ncbi:hypothetical protein N7491_002792 [Penicillium cf. griseofulvum]|nr:hypothetical protein N7491_002792 [Penicillium cf. griseofulvum]
MHDRAVPDSDKLPSLYCAPPSELMDRVEVAQQDVNQYAQDHYLMWPEQSKRLDEDKGGYSTHPWGQLEQKRKLGSSYSEGARLFTAIAKTYCKSQPTQNLEHSLLRGHAEIQSLYDEHLRELGQQYEKGDGTAREQMKDIIIRLQETLLTQLREAEEQGATLDLVMLQMEIDEVRIRALAIMDELYERLSNLPSVPWPISIDPTKEEDSDSGNDIVLPDFNAALEQSLSPDGKEPQDPTAHQPMQFSFFSELQLLSWRLSYTGYQSGARRGLHRCGDTRDEEYGPYLGCSSTLGMGNGPFIEIDSLDDCIKCLGNWRTALAYLGFQGFCGTTMSVLIEDHHRHGVAKTFHVSLNQIDSLIQTIRDTLEEELLKGSMKRWMQKVLNVEDTALSDCDLVGILRSLCGILSIGLVSFSGSHVCRFDANLWGQEMETIPVSLEGYTFKPRKLACLDDFIGGPAWILGKIDTPSKGMKISLTLQDLEELWGPVSLVGGTANQAPVIGTERGFVVPLPREQQSFSFVSPLCAEIECHWVTEIPQHLSDENSDTRILIRDTSRILIGTSTDIEAGLIVNEKCKSSMSHIGQQMACRLQYPGTCKSRYVRDGYDLQFVAGKYVTAGFMQNFKRIPERTLKAMLIADFKRPDTQLVPLLNYRVGLEVSACTGNAQRVTLWDALRLSQTSIQPIDHPTHCAHKVGDKGCISSCWTRWQSMDEIDSLDYKPGKGLLLTGIEARRVVINSVLALMHTGVDSDGNLQVSWPFSNSPGNCPVLSSTPQGSHNWFPVVKDTRKTSSFAVFSQRCLEFSEQGQTRPCSALWQDGHFRPLQTTLSTRILTPTQDGSVSGLLVGVRLLIGGTFDSHEGSERQVGDRRYC